MAALAGNGDPLPRHDEVDVTEVNLVNHGITDLPARITAFQITTLNLSGNKLTMLPELPPTLRVLFLMGNQFSEIPSSVCALPNIFMLSFKNNALVSIPDDLPRSIGWLILTGNKISSLPNNFGDLVHLRKCMLANNLLRELPVSMVCCQALELLRLSNNQLSSIPDWLFELPKLAWLSLGDNPSVTAPPRSTSILSSCDPFGGAVTCGILGQGTSGVVHKGELNGSAVAVKVFKEGSYGSDGLYESEWKVAAAVCGLEAPQSLIQLTAVFTKPHLGLIMECVPETMIDLGLPPSFETVTRDTYHKDACFSLPVLVRIAAHIAEACSYLHEQKVCHGDLYAHNMLFHPKTGDVKFGDFGASFFYGDVTTVSEHAVERAEVRAYGCLLEDLLLRREDIIDDSLGGEYAQQIYHLARECTGPISRRPSFDEITTRVKEIKELVRADLEVVG